MGALDSIFLAQDADPSVLVTSCETGHHTALGEVIQDGQFLGGAYGVPSGEYNGKRCELDPLGPGCKVGVEEEGSDGHLDAFGVEMVLGGGEGVEAQFLGGETDALQFVEEFLITLVVTSDGGELLAVRDYAGHSRIGEDAKFHWGPP